MLGMAKKGERPGLSTSFLLLWVPFAFVLRAAAQQNQKISKVFPFSIILLVAVAPSPVAKISSKKSRNARSQSSWSKAKVTFF
jgi:hypothetical protein